MDFSKLSGRLCVCLILLAGALAHGLCLGADYYMDDFVVRAPEFLAVAGGWREVGFRIFPSMLASMTDQVFPGSAVAQHVWNLLIHLCLAVTIFWGARVFFEAGKLFKTTEQTRRAAFFGALVFACHPICSEALNYSRCTMIQLVALFSLLAAIGTLKFCQRASWRVGFGILAVVLLAAFSKDPGIVHAVGNVIIVTLVFANWNVVTRYLRRPIDWTVACLSVAAFFWMALHSYTTWWINRAMGSIQGGGLGFGEHALTQGRVFWAYLQRIVAPTNLSVDHHVPLTRSMADVPAVLMTAGLFLLVAGVLWMMFLKRTRVYGVLGMLALAPLLLRILYPISELMVEYRVYPAMPFVGMLAGIGLALLYQKNERVMKFAVMFLVIGGVVGSAMRSAVWQDASNLAQDVMDQYPTNNRARAEMQRISYERQEYQAVLDLREESLEAVASIEKYNAKNSGRGRSYLVHRKNEFYLATETKVALVLADVVGSKEALKFISDVESKMKPQHPEYFEKDDPHYRYWHPMAELRELIHVNGAEHDRRLEARRQASVVDPNLP